MLCNQSQLVIDQESLRMRRIAVNNCDIPVCCQPKWRSGGAAPKGVGRAAKVNWLTEDLHILIHADRLHVTGGIGGKIGRKVRRDHWQKPNRRGQMSGVTQNQPVGVESKPASLRKR